MDDHLAQLLAVSDDLVSTANRNPTTECVTSDASDDTWSDLSSAEWEQLLLALDARSPARRQLDEGSSDPEPRRQCHSKQYRQRKRLELMQLRSKVSALEVQLCELQKARQPSSGLVVPGIKHEVVALAWKRIAMHQKTARREAEVENRRLRNEVDLQLRVARKLEKLVRARSTSDDQTAHGGKRQRRDGTLQLNVSLFQQLSRKIQPQLVGVDAMLQQVGFADRKIDVEHVRSCEVRGSSIDVEVLFAKIFPFARESTADAVWQCCGATYVPATGRDAFSAISCTDAQIEMAFSLPLRVRHCDGSLDAHVVMRRCKEQARIVQWYEGVWILRSPDSDYDGVTLSDRGWHVIQDLDGAERSGVQPSSIVQCFSRIELDMSKLSQAEDIHLVRDVLLSLYSQKQQSSFRMFENVLIEQIMTEQMK